MVNQKTLVLSAVDKSTKKAVLNLKDDNGTKSGTIRLYNFTNMPNGILSLGFLIDTEVYKAVLSNKGRELYSFEFKSEQPFEKFSCALVNVKNGDATPILIGVSDGKPTTDLPSRLARNFELLDDENLSVDKATQLLGQEQLDYDDEESQAIENAITAEMDGCEKCAKCSYRNAFYNQNECCVNIKKPQSTYPPNAEAKQFYDEIKGQLEVLFEKYPEETFLNEIIPDSKWVKVDYEDNGEYFVIGLIFEDGQVAYICYGVPGEFSIEPPSEIGGGKAQWLPLDPEKPEDLGYWLTYQDASNGESVNIKIS